MFNFGANRSSNANYRLESYRAAVQQIIASMGVDPQQASMNLEQGYGWSFRRGTAIIEIYILQQGEGGAGFLQVLSPIMHLPQSGLLPLYRRLLELNLQLTNAAFGVFQEVVYVYNERPLDGMDNIEAANIISMVASYADEYDDRLIAEFGGRIYNRA